MRVLVWSVGVKLKGLFWGLFFVLNDREIQKLCGENDLVFPFDAALVNPASLDFCLGDRIVVERRSPIASLFCAVDAVLYRLGLVAPGSRSPQVFEKGASQIEVDISDRTAENPYWLRPGEFVLAQTAERLTLPPTVSADVRLRSTAARSGWMHPPTWIDPGWSGLITLELSNQFTFHSIPLYPGCSIGQFVFSHNAAPIHDYSHKGRYQGAQGVEVAK